MISKQEINNKGYVLTHEQSANLDILHERINIIRAAYGQPMYVTSGVRSLEQHLAIYKKKAQQDKKTTFRIPMGSKHLYAQAVDISDPRGELKHWILKNENILEAAGLWCEDFSYTPTWCHFQVVPPKSNKRFFIP